MNKATSVNTITPFVATLKTEEAKISTTTLPTIYVLL